MRKSAHQWTVDGCRRRIRHHRGFRSRQHRFEGGAILLDWRCSSLHWLAGQPACTATALRKQPEVPAKNTEDAILSGVLMGAAAIDRLIVSSCDHAELTSADVPIFLTGGDTPFYRRISGIITANE